MQWTFVVLVILRGNERVRHFRLLLRLGRGNRNRLCRGRDHRLFRRFLRRRQRRHVLHLVGGRNRNACVVLHHHADFVHIHARARRHILLNLLLQRPDGQRDIHACRLNNVQANRNAVAALLDRDVRLGNRLVLVDAGANQPLDSAN